MLLPVRVTAGALEPEVSIGVLGPCSLKSHLLPKPNRCLLFARVIKTFFFPLGIIACIDLIKC